jgi:dipeptidyl aminopeptidase/acylaminoacyl peptidase
LYLGRVLVEAHEDKSKMQQPGMSSRFMSIGLLLKIDKKKSKNVSQIDTTNSLLTIFNFLNDLNHRHHETSIHSLPHRDQYGCSIAQTKKPITHEDMWLMKRVAAPAVSPDGKWVIFGLTEPSYDEKEQVNDVWIVSTDGSGSPRKLTAGKAGESGYAWSPDGKYIAFVAKRDGEEESQIYLLNFKEGGEAQKLTSLSTGASSPKVEPEWKDDPVFNSNVFPKVYVDSLNKKMIEEKKKIKYKARVYTSFPIRDWDHWRDEKQTHAFVQSIEGGSQARDIFTDVAISKLEGFQFYNATWSNDNAEIVFAATTDFNTGAYQESSSHLYKVSVSGGDATKLTSDKNDYSNPQFTPDGKYLLSYTSANNNYKIYNLNRLVRFDWPSMQGRTIISDKLDRPINNYATHQDQIYMSVEDQGRDKIFSLSINGGEPKVLSQTPTGCHTGVSVSTGSELVIVSNYESASMPAELVKVGAEGKNISLTKFNEAALASLDLQPVEEVWFTSSRGKKIRSLLVKPAGFDSAKKYPLFVLMHGGPAGAWKDNWGYRWNYHLLAKPGYVMILNGLHRIYRVW